MNEIHKIHLFKKYLQDLNNNKKDLYIKTFDKTKDNLKLLKFQNFLDLNLIFKHLQITSFLIQ